MNHSTDAAFPQEEHRNANCEVVHGSVGMSLREYFAGQVLAGVVSNPDMFSAVIDNGDKAPETEVALWCYHVADAMMEARK